MFIHDVNHFYNNNTRWWLAFLYLDEEMYPPIYHSDKNHDMWIADSFQLCVLGSTWYFQWMRLAWINCCLILQALKYFKIIEKTKFFSTWYHHKWLSQLFPIHLNTYVMGLWPLSIYYSFNAGIHVTRHNLTAMDVRFWRLNSYVTLQLVTAIWMLGLTDPDKNI